MSDNPQLTKLKTFLGISGTDQDALLNGYLDMAKSEILNWMYINVGGVPSDVTDIPTKYEQVQIMACVAGFNLSGAENQLTHNENGINRTFKYSNMIDFIHCNVFPII